MITMNAVNFGYKPGRKLFENLNLTAEGGNIYGLLGRNGAGKTTILRLIGGLLFPHTGSVTVSGREAKERQPEMLADLIFVPEEPFLPKISGTAYLSRYAPFYPRFDAKQFEESTEAFGFDVGENLGELSYGQKKKFLLSFALASNCRVTMLDEPTNGLDIPAKSGFRKVLSGSVDESKTVIIATHQVRDIERLIDPIIIIEQSKVVFQRSSEEISKNMRVRLQEKQPEEGVYYEKVFGGYAVLEKNSGDREENIDLELLFNAVTTNPRQIESIFAGEEMSNE
jgi:ABC-2 type transport system ATP-binding protein